MEYHLHIGAHRTGTTSTQNLLQGRSARLREAGVVFLGPQMLRGWGMFEVLQRIVDRKARTDQVSRAREAFSDLIAEDERVNRVVISDENLIGTMLPNYDAATLYPNADKRLAALTRVLPAAPDLVCFTIRDFAAYWRSAFAHLATKGKVQNFAADRLAASPGNSWLPALQAIRAAFPSSRFLILGYDETVASRLIAALIGPDLAARMPAPKRTFGLALPEDAKSGLAALPNGPERDALSLALRASRDKDDRSFSPAQTEALTAAYARDWAALRAGAVAGAVLDPGLAAAGQGTDPTQTSYAPQPGASFARQQEDMR